MLRGEEAFKAVPPKAITSEQGEEELDHDTILHIFRCVDGDSDALVSLDDLMKQVCIRVRGLGEALIGYALVDSSVSLPSLTERRLQFENLEVRPKRLDVEQMYHQHANLSYPGGTNKVCKKPAPPPLRFFSLVCKCIRHIRTLTPANSSAETRHVDEHFPKFQTMDFEGFKRMFPDFQQLILTFQEISRERVEGVSNDSLSSFKDKMRSAKVIIALHHVFASVYQFTFLNKSLSLSLSFSTCVSVY
jgi:hypothetical protein